MEVTNESNPSPNSLDIVDANHGDDPKSPPGKRRLSLSDKADEAKQRHRLRMCVVQSKIGFQAYHKSAVRWKHVDDAGSVLSALMSSVVASSMSYDASISKPVSLASFTFVASMFTAMISAAHTGVDASGRWHTRQVISNKFRELEQEISILLGKANDDAHTYREWSILAKSADARMSLIRSLENDGMYLDSQAERLVFIDR